MCTGTCTPDGAATLERNVFVDSVICIASLLRGFVSLGEKVHFVFRSEGSSLHRLPFELA